MTPNDILRNLRQIQFGEVDFASLELLLQEGRQDWNQILCHFLYGCWTCNSTGKLFSYLPQ